MVSIVSLGRTMAQEDYAFDRNTMTDEYCKKSKAICGQNAEKYCNLGLGLNFCYCHTDGSGIIECSDQYSAFKPVRVEPPPLKVEFDINTSTDYECIRSKGRYCSIEGNHYCNRRGYIECRCVNDKGQVYCDNGDLDMM